MRAWLGSGAEWRRELAAAALFGLFLGALGPFGTWSNGDLGVRIAYWVGILVFGTLVYGVALRLALHGGRRLRQPVWFVLPLAVLVISLPMAGVTARIVLWLWPAAGPHVHPFDWYAQAVLMGLPLSAVAIWTRRSLPTAVTPSEALSVPATGLLDRLPPRLGRSLVCLQMEDHYVRVHTERGSELLLMPLKAAMAEVAEIEGMQVHRSWWVARAAVLQPVQRGREWALRLTNGVEAPVSRSYVAELRAKRWLGADFSP